MVEAERSTGEVVCSNDGRRVAVALLPEPGAVSPASASPPPQVATYEVSTGSLRCQVAAASIEGFSDDNGRVVAVRPSTGERGMQVFSVIDWRTGEVLGGKQTGHGTWLTRPGTGDLLVADRRGRMVAGENRREPVEDFWIVRSDREVVLAAEEVSPLGW